MKIPIKGVIVPNDYKMIYDWFGVESTCPADVENALKEAKGKDVVVEINSGGGYLFEGSEMYYHLVTYPGNVSVDISGLAASAASVVAMAGRCRMAPTAQMMIHNVSTRADGDYRDFAKCSEDLIVANKSVSKAYMQKTGMSQKELLELMDRETWFDADEALRLGLIDEIIGDAPKATKTLLNNMFAAVLPQETINKAREMLLDKALPTNTPETPPSPPERDNSKKDLLQKRLNLLKIQNKGERENE